MKYEGMLIASSGDGWRCRFHQTVEADTPAQARLLIRDAWQKQASRPGMCVREVRLWQDGVPVEYDGTHPVLYNESY